MTESWIANYYLLRKSIQDKPSEDQVKGFLERIPDIEKRLLEEVAQKSDLFKKDFEEIRSKAKLRGSDLTIPQYIQYQLEQLSKKTMEEAEKSSRIEFVMNDDFLMGAMMVLTPIQFAAMSERKLVTSKYQTQKFMRVATGLSFSGPRLGEVKIYQDLFKEDPTGFKAVDYELELIKGMLNLVPNISTLSGPCLTIAGAEFGNRVYKSFYHFLSN